MSTVVRPERVGRRVESRRVRVRRIVPADPATVQAVGLPWPVKAECHGDDEPYSRVLVVGQDVPEPIGVGIRRVRPRQHEVVGVQVVQRRCCGHGVEEVDARDVGLGLKGSDQLIRRSLAVRIHDEDLLRTARRRRRFRDTGQRNPDSHEQRNACAPQYSFSHTTPSPARMWRSLLGAVSNRVRRESEGSRNNVRGALGAPHDLVACFFSLPATDRELHREVPALDRAGPR